MRLVRILAGVVLPLALLATTGFARTAAPPEPLAFGETVYDLAGPAADGSVVSLSDLAIDRAKAEAAVLALGREANEGAEVTLASSLADLPGLRDGDALDASAALAFASRLGKRFGLVPHAEKVAAASTLGDLVEWVVASEDAPTLVVAWSPRCPKCEGIYDERIHTLVAESGVRLVVLASNYNDTSDAIGEYLASNDYHWNVILDPDQRIADRLGARRTATCFLLDAERTLRFRGALDNDPRGEKEGEARKEYVRGALEAVRTGAEIDASMNDTKAPG